MHTLSTELRGNVLHLSSRLALQGPLGQLTTLQTSRSHARRFHSLAFREELERRGESRTFDVQFDSRSGVIRARRSGNDEASAPYLKDYRDPLGLLHQVRHLHGGEPDGLIPMLGHDVTVKLLGELELETALGLRPVFVYQLLPGGSRLYIGQEAPWPILQMQQLLGSGPPLEARVSRVGRGETLAPQAERSKTESRSRRPPRRRRRRRKTT